MITLLVITLSGFQCFYNFIDTQIWLKRTVWDQLQPDFFKLGWFISEHGFGTEKLKQMCLLWLGAVTEFENIVFKNLRSIGSRLHNQLHCLDCSNRISCSNAHCWNWKTRRILTADTSIGNLQGCWPYCQLQALNFQDTFDCTSYRLALQERKNIWETRLKLTLPILIKP